MEAAHNIKFACSIGRFDRSIIADLIEHSTRCSQLDLVAKAAADLLVSLPLHPAGHTRCRDNRLTQHQRPALKLARALRSLADEDVPLDPRVLRTIKRLTA